MLPSQISNAAHKLGRSPRTRHLQVFWGFQWIPFNRPMTNAMMTRKLDSSSQISSPLFNESFVVHQLKSFPPLFFDAQFESSFRSHFADHIHLRSSRRQTH